MRPWPLGLQIPDAWVAPPCGLATQLVVVDLATMRVVGRSRPKQRVFVSGEEVEQKPVQVTRHLVATTGEDAGLVIDRHSGVHIAR